ncbi:MAG: SRPBCC family protein [Planctomycetes bacterium]|nr:SRPBCC family protein [Planctomycetota bacterium]MBM4298875.1 SRPBCC family protein [Deltaproteobacteria bacterium]
MDDIWIWILVSVGIVAGALVMMYVVGYFLPADHEVSRTITLKQQLDVVWQVITDFANMPSWHKDVVKVERLPDKNGHEVWKETQAGDFVMSLETTESTPPTRLVRTIADDGGAFTGRWEFVLTAMEGGCTLSITEFGEVANPFFRFMFRMFMKPEYYLERYLNALEARFADAPTEKK